MTSDSKSIFVVVVVFFLNSRIMSDFILLLYFFGHFYFTFSTLVVRKTIFNDKKQDTPSSSCGVHLLCASTGCPRLLD